MARGAALILAVLAAAAPAAGSPKQAREIHRLRAEVKALKAEVAKVTKERDSTRFVLVATQVDNNNLRAGLPDAIRAVPSDRFWELVFTPAREAWGCDSLYTSEGYWSLDFYSTC